MFVDENGYIFILYLHVCFPLNFVRTWVEYFLKILQAISIATCEINFSIFFFFFNLVVMIPFEEMNFFF